MSDLVPAGHGLVAPRRFVESRPIAHFTIGPGDRILVAPGDAVLPGATLAERQRHARLEDGPPFRATEPGAGAGNPLQPGDWWSGDGHQKGGPLRRRHTHTEAGELLFRAEQRWRIATGDHPDALVAPAAGTVRSVTSGREIAVEMEGMGLAGAFVAGSATMGRLERVGGEAGLRGALDIGRAGAILAVDGRIDSEAIIRARAMGVRGLVVSGLADKDLRDLDASDARQRASLQPLPPFAVLVLDGVLRSGIPAPVMALLAALEGSEVGIVVDPPRLIFDLPADGLPAAAVPSPDWVRVRAGERSGREGRWLGCVGLRRFAAGVHLEAAAIAIDDETVILPIADLERYA